MPTCPLCDAHLSTSNDMRKHLEICANKTSQCPYCSKYILRGILAYHINHDCTDPIFTDQNTKINSLNENIRHINLNSDRNKNETTSFNGLFEGVAHVHDNLQKDYYQTETKHVAEKLQFNIMIIGSPRVGKSQLINALCNGENLAQTSQSLDSCTKNITKYVLQDNKQRLPTTKPFAIHFYDTPGIESWENKAGENSMIKFIEEINPICMIYCASPGSFARTEQLRTVLEYCRTREIFCALACTNMWSGNGRNAVIEDFEKNLSFFGEKIEKFSIQPNGQPHKITFFGKGALCTMVNSIEYYDPDLSDQRKPVQGIDELIHGIMEALDQEKLLGWCYAVLYRRTYWEKISQKVNGFFSLRLAQFQNFITSSPDRTASNLLVYLYQYFLKKQI